VRFLVWSKRRNALAMPDRDVHWLIYAWLISALVAAVLGYILHLHF
jgi:choline-glycine betaine transporter